MKIQTKVTPWLSFASQALEAAELYVSLIPDTRIDRVTMNPATETPIVGADQCEKGMLLAIVHSGQLDRVRMKWRWRMREGQENLSMT